MDQDWTLRDDGKQWFDIGECDPEKAKTCPKTECHINGGPCTKTSVISWRKSKTNQDKIAENVRTMDPEALADWLSKDDTFVCEINCPVYEQYGYSKCPEGKMCVDSIAEWLKEECKDGN